MKEISEAIVYFNENSNSEFGISAFDISDQRGVIPEVIITGLYYRATGKGVYAESCDDFALNKLERDIERIVRVKFQREIEVSVKYSFYSK